MSTIQLHVTDTLKTFLEKQAAKRGFPSPKEYVQSLLSEMQQREADRWELEEKLREGIRSPSLEADEAFWRNLKEDFLSDHPELRSCTK